MRSALNATSKKLPFLIGMVVLCGLGYFQLHNLATGVSGFVKPEEEELPVATHNSQFISCPGKVTTDTDVSFIPTRISISSVDVNLPIISVALAQGTWKVYPGAANYAQGTAEVTLKGGNVGIYGHDRADAFTNIKKLNVGDTIEVTDSGHKAIYKVSSAQVVQPTEVSVFYPTENSTLTLITCDGVFSQQRYAVKADLVSIEDLNC